MKKLLLLCLIVIGLASCTKGANTANCTHSLVGEGATIEIALNHLVNQMKGRLLLRGQVTTGDYFMAPGNIYIK